MEKVRPLTITQKYILKDFFERSLAGETMEEIASSHNISRKTLSVWKNCKEGKALHDKFQKEMSSQEMPKFYRVLSEKMQSGSYKHMELYAKIHGLLVEKKEVLNKTEVEDRLKNGFSNEDLDELEALINGETTLKRVK
ncbi:phBC6A51 family helix-turn-helix protein [Rhodococcus sp. IEGM1300]